MPRDADSDDLPNPVVSALLITKMGNNFITLEKTSQSAFHSLCKAHVGVTNLMLWLLASSRQARCSHVAPSKSRKDSCLQSDITINITFSSFFSNELATGWVTRVPQTLSQ